MLVMCLMYSVYVLYVLSNVCIQCMYVCVYVM